jgi:hypothetical protein
MEEKICGTIKQEPESKSGGKLEDDGFDFWMNRV